MSKYKFFYGGVFSQWFASDFDFDASGYDAWVLGGAGRKYIKKVENGSGLFTQ